jgi:Mg-chelatase subunit ChlD
MKSKIITIALFVVTAATVALYPAYRSVGAVDPAPVQDPPANARPRVEVVFVLDTTGSMSGMIQAAKEKIWSIAATMAAAQPAPDIRMGLVAYRDRGDAYVTKTVDLSSDLDSMYAALMDLQADGGGDGPESVNQALHDAVYRMSWSQESQSYKVLFLVGDAPPHMDYQDDVKYPDTLAAAATMGIVVNAIQCGRNGHTTAQWERIARLGRGDYFRVEQAGSAVAIATPFDSKMAALSEKLDKTRLYYGTAEEKEKQQLKVDASSKLHAAASVESRARRAAFNATESGAANLLGEGELVDDVESGRVDLSTIGRERLPEPMQPMTPRERQALIADTAERRKELKREIEVLADERAGYLRQKVEALGGARDSLDRQIYDAVRAQAGKAGIHYEADAPAY